MKRVFKFLGETRAELAKVVWPTRGKALRLSIVVVIVTIIVGAFLAAVDYGLSNGVEYAIDTAEKGGAQGNPNSVPVNAGGPPGEQPPPGAPVPGQ